MMLSIILIHLFASIFAISKVGAVENEKPIGSLEVLYSSHSIRYDFTGKPELAFDYNNGGYTGVLLAGAKFLNGTLFVSFPRWSGTVPATFGTLNLTTGLVTPFPSWEVNDHTNEEVQPENKLYSVLGFEFGEDDQIFVLDQGKVSDREAVEGSIKVMVLSYDGDILQTYPIPTDIASTFNSFVNDLVYDPVRKFLYISDCGKPISEQGVSPQVQHYEGQIISLDLTSGKYRSFLRGTVFTNPETDYEFHIRDTPYRTYTGVDGIALTNDGEYLYFCPLTSNKLYRIKTSYLRENHKDGDLDDKVELVFEARPSASDGLMIDGSNNMYLTGIESFAVYMYESSLLDANNPDSGTRLLPLVVDEENLGWCDTLGFDDDGSITVVSNNLDLFDQGLMFANDDPNIINFKISKIKTGATPYWRNILRIQEIGETTPSSGVSTGAAVGIGIGCFVVGLIPFIVLMVMKSMKKGGKSGQSLVKKPGDKDDASSSFGASSRA